MLLFPNRLGAGVGVVVDVESVVGLLARKEKAGVGAAVESAVPCPKVKTGFGGSVVDGSLLSAGLPKVKVGVSAGAEGLPKEKPPVEAAAGAGSVSLLAAPNMNADGTGDGSFFSAGFPKVNVGAGISFSAGREPKVVAPEDVEVAKPPNTEPEVGSLGREVLLSDSVVVEGAGLVLFSGVGAEGVKPTVAEVEVLSVLFSSGFDSPKVKAPLEESIALLEEPVPKTIPPPFPNLNAGAAGSSDFLSSVEVVPNLMPSEEPPNLNPEEAVSLESDEELPKEVPNLKPPDAEEESGKEPPNLKPPDPSPVAVLSDTPNLIPPEVDEPNGEETAPNPLDSTCAPGLFV